ncbi:MAG: cupin domain-containing protein [Opitutales bacterium]
MTAEEVVEKLRLERHPEGGWYRRSFKSSERLMLERGVRFASTSIYYLLAKSEYSSWHVLASDETWFFHEGCGLIVHLFGENGYEMRRLGVNLLAGEEPQLIIPAGTTFAAELRESGEWCLISCTVCPGFDFEDFSFGDAEALLGAFPENCKLIERLGRR